MKSSLDKIQSENIIESVAYSEWAPPRVVVPKKQGSEVRFCSDFMVTINKFVKNMSYPLPTLDI